MLQHSRTYLSCLYTMGITSQTEPRQRVPEEMYVIPDYETRLLRARLILEESVETIKALGFEVVPVGDFNGNTGLSLEVSGKPLVLEDILDGCCDTIYVATGCLVSMGIPDNPHLAEVCRANNQKFPGGAVTKDPVTGKYLKPDGWCPPRHQAVRGEVEESVRKYPDITPHRTSEVLIAPTIRPETQ